MKFYKIGFENQRGMAWAGGYGPIDDLWFLHPTFLDRKKAFWRVAPRKPGLYIDQGGKKWPDILGCGSAPPLFFISERLVLSLQGIGAPLGRITEMPIVEINAKALLSESAPRYFVVETKPGIEVDLVATGFKVDASGKAILNPPPNPWPSRHKYRLDSWNGSDLFAYRHFGPTDGPYLDMFCSERIKELAEREGWTNVRFKPIDVV